MTAKVNQPQAQHAVPIHGISSFAPPPPGDCCGKELDWCFTEEQFHPPLLPPRRPLRLGDLPRHVPRSSLRRLEKC
jgi:murein endopeptidase